MKTTTTMMCIGITHEILCVRGFSFKIIYNFDGNSSYTHHTYTHVSLFEIDLTKFSYVCALLLENGHKKVSKYTFKTFQWLCLAYLLFYMLNLYKLCKHGSVKILCDALGHNSFDIVIKQV